MSLFAIFNVWWLPTLPLYLQIYTYTQVSKAAYKRVKKEQPYVNRDVFSETFPDFDKMKGTLVDPYHEFGNWVNDVRGNVLYVPHYITPTPYTHMRIHSHHTALIFNVEGTGQHWKKTRRDEEHKWNRFLEVGTAAPWHVVAESERSVDKLLRKFKHPTDWGSLKDFCVPKGKKRKYMKLSERAAFLSHRGLYILGMQHEFNCEMSFIFVNHLLYSFQYILWYIHTFCRTSRVRR